MSIQKNRKNAMLKSFSIWIFVPFCLILFWLFASFFLNKNIVFSTLEYSYGSKIFNNYNQNLIKRGDKIDAVFRSNKNYLGIVKINFTLNNNESTDYDNIIFKIKEKGANSWYYVHKYTTKIFNNDPFFPFGFPPINDSKNKLYLVEIESTNGAKENALSLSEKNNVVLATIYKYPKALLLHNRMELFSFLKEKFINTFTDINFVLYSLAYLFPFVFYFFFLFYRKKRYIFLVLTTILYILLSCAYSYYFVLNVTLFLIAWLAVIMPRIRNISFIISLLFLLLIAVALLINAFDFANRLGLYLYILLMVGFIGLLSENINMNVLIGRLLNK